MRYSLHDAQADFILLSQELDYLERYVDLQKLRTAPDRLTVTTHWEVAEVGHRKIAPMILIPFVENAFKYGVSTTEVSNIDIDVAFVAGVLSLRVQNTVHARRTGSSEETPGGLGLTNVQERLRLIYPDRYQLVHGNPRQYLSGGTGRYVSMTINAIAVDDEPHALQVIVAHAAKIPLLNLWETFTDPFRALEYVHANPIDLIFLDINMPDLSGLTFIRTHPKGRSDGYLHHCSRPIRRGELRSGSGRLSA